MATVSDDPADAPARYRCVTVVAGGRCLDLALPASVPLADLMPGVVRLLHGAEGPNSRPAPDWCLTPVGRATLPLADTLGETNVVDGDVLVLGDAGTDGDAPPPAGTVRDAVEHGVDTRYGAWDARATARWAWWTTMLALVALVVPISALPGPARASVAACGAVVAATVAVRAGRGDDPVCAATAVVVASLSAGWAGAVLAAQWSGPWWPVRAVSPELLAVPALCAALLLSSAVAARWRPAIVAAVALATALVPLTVLAGLALTGADQVRMSLAAAVVVALVMGGLPRFVLAVTGLSNSDPDGPRFPGTLQRAQWVLAGCLLGGSGAVVACTVPAAATDDRGLHLLAVGVGCLMLLRARAFSLISHTVALRIAAVLVFAAVWAAACRDLPSSRLPLVMGSVVALAALSLVPAWHRPERQAPVSAARAARALDAVESLLVVGVLVGTAGALGLAHWAISVLG